MSEVFILGGLVARVTRQVEQMYLSAFPQIEEQTKHALLENPKFEIVCDSRRLPLVFDVCRSRKLAISTVCDLRNPQFSVS